MNLVLEPLNPDLIQKLPSEVKPYSDKDLIRRVEWRRVYEIDFEELVEDFQSPKEFIEAITDATRKAQFAYQRDFAYATADFNNFPLQMKTDSEGEYEEYKTVYHFGFFEIETDAQMVSRLIVSRTGKINNFYNKARKAEQRVEDKERRRLLAEGTKQADIELAKRLAEKHGWSLLAGPTLKESLGDG